MSLLEVTDLKVTFPTDALDVTAVRGMNFRVDTREVLAIVGESGSGKSATAMALIGLLPPYAEVSGSVKLHGDELIGLGDQRMSRVRGAEIGMVFQDPMSALTPVYNVGDQIAEALRIHQPDLGRAAARTRAVELLDLVGIAQPERRARAFPHELSGGERQRVVIAIAIANDPDLIICDEPTTALDVTVQAQILDVLKTARDITGAGVLIITHDLGVVAEFADRALVMYAGRAVEVAPVATLYAHRVKCPTPQDYSAPCHGWRHRRAPGWCPSPVPRRRWLRCRKAVRSRPVVRSRSTTCRTAEPELRSVATDHTAACIRTDQVSGRTAAEIYGVSTAPPEGAAAPARWCCASRI